MRIKEFAALTGVSIRTLHYYDEIGLLKPSAIDEVSGYRYYDEESLERMQEIQFYRELDFPLKQIQEILSSPNYDKKQALQKQRKLLILKKQRLERLICALENAEKGEVIMAKNVFDNSEFEQARAKYAEEAKERWGNTDAYAENAKKTSGYSKDKWNEVLSGMEEIFKGFADIVEKGLAADSEEAQNQVAKWQQYITDTQYTCTKEILAGLGQMYVCDERFQKNLDKYGEGTAEFMSRAIAYYCEK